MAMAIAQGLCISSPTEDGALKEMSFSILNFSLTKLNKHEIILELVVKTCLFPYDRKKCCYIVPATLCIAMMTPSHIKVSSTKEHHMASYLPRLSSMNGHHMLPRCKLQCSVVSWPAPPDGTEWTPDSGCPDKIKHMDLLTEGILGQWRIHVLSQILDAAF